MSDKGTSIKRPKKPFKGNEGKTFDSNYQPSPEAKKEGWKEWRKRRLLTQGILKNLLDKEGVPNKEGEDYFKTLVQLAKSGNAKAIETINKAFEDEIIKSEIVVTKVGKDLADEGYV
jgi:hypothetical protein